MTKFGWVDERVTVGGRIDALLGFFGVATPATWQTVYEERLVAFRSSASFENRLAPTAAWLRKGELEATRVALGPWNPKRFRTLLPALRGLSLRADFEPAWSELTAACAASGVAVVLVRPPKGCRASGATFFMGAGRAVLMLSGRYKSDDHLWFSFFHEAGHLLLHGKKGLFLEGLQLSGEKEDEANVFAAELLIPPEHQARLAGLSTEAEVRAFADELGIAAGIIVGRLQHDGKLPPTHLNGLKRRFEWTEDEGDDG